jgi:hypothetical protein
MAVGLFQELQESVSSEIIPVRHCFGRMKTVLGSPHAMGWPLGISEKRFWKELTDDLWARWKPGNQGLFPELPPNRVGLMMEDSYDARPNGKRITCLMLDKTGYS